MKKTVIWVTDAVTFNKQFSRFTSEVYTYCRLTVYKRVFGCDPVSRLHSIGTRGRTQIFLAPFFTLFCIQKGPKIFNCNTGSRPHPITTRGCDNTPWCWKAPVSENILLWQLVNIIQFQSNRIVTDAGAFHCI
jgi:hypothetical protein